MVNVNLTFDMNKEPETLDKIEKDLFKVEAEIRRLTEQVKKSVFRINLLVERQKYLESLMASAFPLYAEEYLNDYSKFSLTEAVKDVLQKKKEPMTAAEILQRMESGGFQTTAKSPYTNVYMTCLKLSNRGVIREITKDGKRMFAKK